MTSKNTSNFLIIQNNNLDNQCLDLLQNKSKSLYKTTTKEEAIEILLSSHIDLVIIDTSFSLDNDFIKLLKKEYSNIEIIVISKEQKPEYIIELLNIGISKFLLSTFSYEEFQTVLNKTIENINIKRQNRQHKKKLDLILDNVVNSLFLIDYDFNIVKSNKAAKENFKCIDDNKQSIFEIISTDNKDFKQILTKDIFTLKEILNVEEKVRTIFNNTLETKINFFLLETENLILISIRNETTLIKYENQIKKYVTTIDKHILSLRLDYDLEIVYASDAFTKYIGMETYDLVGSSLKKYVEDKNAFDKLPFEMNKTQEVTLTFTMIDVNGNIKYLDGTFTKIVLNNSSAGYTLILKDISYKNELEKFVIVDSLTQLHNRRYFEKTKEDYINKVKREDCFVSLCVLCVDSFEEYTLEYGDNKAEDLLKNIAATLKEVLKREIDYLFRIDREQFVLLFKANEIKYVNIMTDRILEEINKFIKNKFSMGQYTVHTSELNSIEELYEDALDLNTKSKNNTKNICISNTREA